MTLKKLTVHNLRNLTSVDLEPSPGVNLIYGENGSGKTSVLEAINLLSVGRSFRNHKIKPLINEKAESLTVFGKVHSETGDIPVGVSRVRKGDSTFKAAGRPVGSLAELASFLPLQIVNAQAFQLLEGSPKDRRQFLDWLVFHVEPGFYTVWKSAQRSLKHRNSLLRHDRIDAEQLYPWDRELSETSHAIQQMRERCFKAFLTYFEDLVSEFVNVDALNLRLYSGWEEGAELQEVLNASRERDIKQGFTGNGFHRADIKIKVGNQLAADVLSRGQQKLLVCALKIAQGLVFTQKTKRTCLYLVDDLPAELDAHYRKLLVKWLHRLGTQVFITGVERGALLDPWASLDCELAVFHVEHGNLIYEDSADSEQP